MPLFRRPIIPKHSWTVRKMSHLTESPFLRQAIILKTNAHYSKNTHSPCICTVSVSVWKVHGGLCVYYTLSRHSGVGIFGGTGVCFADNGLSDKCALCPTGHFSRYWELRIIGRWTMGSPCSVCTSWCLAGINWCSQKNGLSEATTNAASGPARPSRGLMVSVSPWSN